MRFPLEPLPSSTADKPRLPFDAIQRLDDSKYLVENKKIRQRFKGSSVPGVMKSPTRKVVSLSITVVVAIQGETSETFRMCFRFDVLNRAQHLLLQY